MGLKVCANSEILHCVQNDADNFSFQFRLGSLVSLGNLRNLGRSQPNNTNFPNFPNFLNNL